MQRKMEKVASLKPTVSDGRVPHLGIATNVSMTRRLAVNAGS